MKRRIFAMVMALLTVIAAFGADEKITVMGRVKDAVTKRDLTKACVKIYDNKGELVDSIMCNMGRNWRGANDVDTLSQFFFGIPRVDTVLVFDVVCPGYKDKTISYEVHNPGRRARWIELPLVMLERAPRELKEVTVTSTKIKFYNKGDTLVYNADAFQLAEGSMLDELIAQLPGAELSDDGQIKVNGEFVESLLLNGKQFMDGNNNLMLENISAYSVKNINVYEGQKKQDVQMGNINAPKVLTMDVRLKKEYNFGWIGNIQGGYGTEDRYLGRLFASWFNATTRVSLVGNINNLNDNRKPGRNDTWTPDKMPNGQKKYSLGALDYNYESADERTVANGSVMFEQTINNSNRTTSRINFLPGGDTYDYMETKARDRETRVSTSHFAYNRFGTKKNFMVGVSLSGNYNYQKNRNSDLSATLNKEQEGTVAEIIDLMYSDVTGDSLTDMINRSATKADGWTKTLVGGAYLHLNTMLSNASDVISLSIGGSYSSIRNELWNDYNVNFYNSGMSSVNRRNYTDNTPNNNKTLTSTLRYNTQIGDVRLEISYNYRFSDQTKDSYMYAMDRLNDMGIYGVVPDNYLEAFDPANSYESRLITNTHAISPGAFYYKPFESSYLSLRINPDISIAHRHLDYFRDGRDYRYSHTNTVVNIASIFDGMIEYGFQKSGEGRASRYRHSLRYSYRITPRLPDVEDLLDIVNDSDPMNIYYGNPDLKTQFAHAHLVRWSYTPVSHTLQNVLYLGYNHTTNSLTRGYTYDTATGVRYNRMYNVSGNNRGAVTNELSLQFGAKKQFTASSETDIVMSNSTDMIGTNGESPEFTKVHQNSFSEKIRLGWQIGKQNLQLRGDFLTRNTTSSRPEFETINAKHINFGVSGVFTLPAGFGISTDLVCYTRRGYGSPNLDTTNPVWNVRLSYSPVRNKHWVFNIDSFDMLHQLTYVTYAVTASGRTVAYTNALPRYILASVQYRFNIQPKK